MAINYPLGPTPKKIAFVPYKSIALQPGGERIK
jgi:hypothetical protein